jgi:hypothetical protein
MRQNLYRAPGKTEWSKLHSQRSPIIGILLIESGIRLPVSARPWSLCGLCSTRSVGSAQAHAASRRPDTTPGKSTIGDDHMPLVTLVITLIVVGVLLWLVNLIPMQGTIKGILNLVVVIAVVIWLLKVFNLLGYITQFRVGH